MNTAVYILIVVVVEVRDDVKIHRKVWGGGNVVNIYSSGARFESRM